MSGASAIFIPKPTMRSASAASRQGEAGSAATTSRMSKAAVRLARGEHDEGDQQDRFAEQRERHIDAAGAARPGVFVMRDEVIGGDADQRIDEIEGQKIGGDEDAETAGHRQEP